MLNFLRAWRPKPRSGIDEAEVIERIVNGESRLFSVLVSRYEALVVSTVSKLVPPGQAMDIAQEAFLELYDSLGRISPEGGLHGFVKTLCIRKSHDFWRKASNRESPVSEYAENHQEWLEDAPGHSESNSSPDISHAFAQRDFVAKALDHFGATDRMIITLVWLEEYTQAETAEMLGISLANVKIRCHRCRNKLKKVMAELQGETP